MDNEKLQSMTESISITILKGRLNIKLILINDLEQLGALYTEYTQYRNKCKAI